MSIEAMKQALEVLLDSIDDVRDCLNQNLQHEGWPRYDRRIEAYREQIAKHEKAIADLTTAIEAAEKQEPGLPLELRGVQEAVKDGSGFWRSCTGCHELNEGYDTGPFSKVFGCALGNGCSECGGIGAIWDDTDYEEMAKAMFDTTPPAAPVQEPVQTTGETNVQLGFYSDATGTGQQRQLVGEVEMGQLVGDGPHKSAGNPDAEGAVAVIEGVDEHGPMLGWYKHWINFHVGTQFYTIPPAAQRQWVGLTDEEVLRVWLSPEAGKIPHCDRYLHYYRAIEAKLREKNGGAA